MSFSFTFFVHGDTVCASIDLREHPAVRPLTKEHLAEAAAAFAAASGGAAQRGQQQDGGGGAATPGGGAEAGGRTGAGAGASSTGTASLPAASPVDGEKPAAAAAATPTQARKVMLAPFGIAAILTGNSYKASDPMAEKILEDWASFFPLCNKDNTDVPPVVEVVSGEYSPSP